MTDRSTDRENGSPDQSGDDQTTTPYVRSPVITSAARTMVPFVLTYGLYLVLFGAYVPGGGFQGGVVMAATIVLLGLVYGLDPTREWIDNRLVVLSVFVGFSIFGVVALGAFLFEGAALEIAAFPIPITTTVELVEIAIGFVVGGLIAGIFLAIGAGLRTDSTGTTKEER